MIASFCDYGNIPFKQLFKIFSTIQSQLSTHKVKPIINTYIDTCNSIKHSTPFEGHNAKECDTTRQQAQMDQVKVTQGHHADRCTGDHGAVLRHKGDRE